MEVFTGNHPKIHLFDVKDKRFVFDVNSCVFFEINELVYNILELIEEVSVDELIDRLSKKYSMQDILSNLAEIQKLIESKELFSEDRFSQFKADSLHPVSTLCMNVSHDCNLKCAYCFGEKYNLDRLLMSHEVAEKSVDFMIENSKNQKELSLSFFGGEPLLNFPVVEHAVRYAKEIGKRYRKNFNFHVTTNGTLLDPEIIEFLVENKFSLIISLDGPKEINDSMRKFSGGKGSYDVVCRNIKAILSRCDAFPGFTVRSTFTKKNLDIENLAMHLASLGCRDISVEPCVTEIEELRIKEEDLKELKYNYDVFADRYLDEIQCGRYFSFFHLRQTMNQTHCRNFRLTQCGAGQGYLAVGADGRLYPCHEFVGQEQYVLGDVFNGIKNSNIQMTFLSAHVRNKKECMQCWARYICGGGCHACAIMFNKDIFQPYEVGCELMKHRIKLGAYLYASLKNKSPLVFQEIYNESLESSGVT